MQVKLQVEKSSPAICLCLSGSTAAVLRLLMIVIPQAVLNNASNEKIVYDERALRMSCGHCVEQPYNES
ncbi:hypothetical protein E2C01_013428 [Portunus trituberculatus]|uniref:Uncharacterized protein n=1 Tax=Portunus trituberculatus TaxID=210409 RepID=A0A5B7DH41_PORTR|nr:hypothetical protein [Portunus trituberculatus]